MVVLVLAKCLFDVAKAVTHSVSAPRVASRNKNQTEWESIGETCVAASGREAQIDITCPSSL